MIIIMFAFRQCIVHVHSDMSRILQYCSSLTPDISVVFSTTLNLFWLSYGSTYYSEKGQRGYTPVFLAIWGYRRNARTEGVPMCPNLRQMQFQSAGKTPAAHAEHAHLFSFFVGNVLGANRTAALEGAKGSSLLTTSGVDITPQIY